MSRCANVTSVWSSAISGGASYSVSSVQLTRRLRDEPAVEDGIGEKVVNQRLTLLGFRIALTTDVHVVRFGCDAPFLVVIAIMLASEDSFR